MGQSLIGSRMNHFTTHSPQYTKGRELGHTKMLSFAYDAT